MKRSSGTVKVNGIEIYYEVHGSGEPLLLIEGLGYSSWMWYKQVPALSERYKVVIFDNRGAGNTDKPDSEYSIELMADDAAGLLAALEIESAHVLGVSLGGYIAQELALRHPERVRSLILVSTNSGPGKPASGKSPIFNGFLKFWGFLPGMLEISGKASIPPYGVSREESIRHGLSLAFTPEYFSSHPDEIERIVGWRLENPQPDYAWRRQLAAGISFDCGSRAREINARTLLIGGSQDRIVSPESALELSEKIPNSALVIMPGAGHLLFIERSEEFNSMVLGFLHDVSGAWEDSGLDDAGKRNMWRRFKFLFSRNGKHQRPDA